MIESFLVLEERLMPLWIEEPCTQGLYRALALQHGLQVRQLRPVAFQLNQLLLVLQVLLKHSQRLAAGRLIEAVTNIVTQALQRHGQAVFTHGGQEIVEQLANVLAG